MKTILLLLSAFAFVVLGAGCINTAGDIPRNPSESSDQVMMEQDEGMMEEDDSMMQEEDTMMEEDAMEDDSMMMNEEVFDLVATNFKYDITEIRVKKGDTVVINLSVEDGFHDWVVDEFNARTRQMNAGDAEAIEFVADKTGEFEYYCSVGRHREMGMVGKLIVE